ncbi:MAG: hypothetical protein EOR85_12960 [Mesorhizobium sp.]|uniref:hypothetical protein n=1 Tax=Mesorhizobium sp. TaxID=1871066 RepID=UPI000FE508FE|nr:hypothetical protein [Mesorhizobium sp.]RWI96370.1 MAG: hypothetical protein EOR23_34220 [Mesorhizobium sp.]RWK61801.1 MAG: hypothetical protein EOR49_16075 [Mesorhizobium sp.]RWL21966.1 MAG: hypothetical protein EOR57_05895 [Mesorhizobium sp.]RWM47680.1 MAG: hypothetical protein EOR76_14285 [Mesorhizobium sp.]RWN02412.1 MAG: hypothetical protein EOR85_12960 [Mesorhizobium sp.]
MKTVTIEELLTWAFVHELPKGGGVDGLDNANSAWRMLEASSWGKITSFAELGAIVDQGRGDTENYWIEQGEPHDDAVAVGRAVAGLSRCDVAVPAGWNALADWPDTEGMAEAAVRKAVERYMVRTPQRRAAGIVSLVVGTAILGREPDFGAEPSKVRMIERGGKPAWFVVRRMKHEDGQTYDLEVDGYNGRTQRPVKGAYRKYEFSIDPTGDILGRLDYQIWVAALRRLEAEIATQLVGHRLVFSDRSMTPWLEGDRPGVAIVERAADRPAKKTAVAC